VAQVQVERTLVKSPPELWAELASEPGISRWLGDIEVAGADAPRRLEWTGSGTCGVIELEASGWGTKIRAVAEARDFPAWERIQNRYELQRRLTELLDDLGASSLKRG
jgi:hypothetical protein